jgi:hypothetical protein
MAAYRLPRSFAADLFSIENPQQARRRRRPHARSARRHVLRALLQPRLPETASLDPASGTPATARRRWRAAAHLSHPSHWQAPAGARPAHALQARLLQRPARRPHGPQAPGARMVDFQLSAGIKPTGVLRGQTLPILETAFGIEETPAGHLYVRQATGTGVRHGHCSLSSRMSCSELICFRWAIPMHNPARLAGPR